MIVEILLTNEVFPKLSRYSIPPLEGMVKNPVLPVIFLELVIPLSLIGISLLESSIVPTIIPLLAAYNSPTKALASLPDREILELSSSNSIFVFDCEESDIVVLIPGALLIISSSSSPNCSNTSGSSPKIL